jgi:polysaccharide biosynthesis transport protein
VDNSTSALRHYLGVLRRRGWLIVVLATIAGGAALAAALTSEPVYRASMKIVVGQGGGVFQPAFGNSVQPFTQTMTNLLESNVVAQAAIDRLQTGQSPDEVLSALEVRSAPDSSVLEVTYDSRDRGAAVQMLGAIGGEFTRVVQQSLGAGRSDTSSGSNPPVTATIFDPPYLLEGQVAPRPVRDTVLAALLGAAVGLVLAFVLEALDDKLRGRRDAEDWFGARVIGVVPRGTLRLGPRGAIDALAGARRKPPQSVAMDVLVANVALLTAGVDRPMIGVTSARQDDGRGLVSAALAQALALSGRSVIVIDADLARPSAPKYLPTDPAVSLPAVLAGYADLPRALAPVRDWPHQVVLPPRVLCAELGAAPSAPVAPDALRNLLTQARALSDVVIVTLPPALASAEAMTLIPELDRILVVAREGTTLRGDAEGVQELVADLPIGTLAIVLTESDSRPRLGTTSRRRGVADPDRVTARTGV